MKIVQRCDYKFPAHGSAGAERVVERTCRGLQKLGHEVVLWGKPGSHMDDIFVVDELPEGFDIIHHHGWCWDKEDEYNSWGTPWVSTIHGGGMETDPRWLNAANNNPHIVCVSKFVADRINCKAFVHACSDPDEFIFKEEKKNYFLYLAGLAWGTQKGLDVFINLSRKLAKYDFVIAGTGSPVLAQTLENISSKQKNLIFVGEINGAAKAEWLADAKALILPTLLPDACPTTVSEALISGTPIIGSENGSLPEIIPESCGFICKSEVEYVKSILNIGKIKSKNCRDYAMENYSDVATAKKYLTYYENMIKYGRVSV